jgi:hypothetical protein
MKGRLTQKTSKQPENLPTAEVVPQIDEEGETMNSSMRMICAGFFKYNK